MKPIIQKFAVKRVVLITSLVLTMSGCLHDDNDKTTPPVEPPATNAAPTVSSSATTTVEEGTAYSYSLVAADADGDTLTLSATTIPAWLAFDAASGALTGTPATGDVGDHAVTLSVSDGTDATTQSFTITVTAIVVPNTAPVITSTGTTSATVGTNYSYQLTATDADNDTLDMSAVMIPAWASFDSVTGVLSGTPDAAGDSVVELMVSDGTDAANQTFTITAVAVAAGPTQMLSIFENAALPQWAAWDCCAGSTPAIVTDDVEHDQVTEFTITGDTVMGFTARNADGAVGGTPYDASSFATTGSISFDLKMTTPADAGQVAWAFKIESNNAATAAEVSLTTSVEGHATPILDTWQTYTFPISALVAAGLDPSAIDVVMIFPAWGTGNGAVYLVDNVQIINDETVTEPMPSELALTVFDDAAQAQWALWDCCAASTPAVITDDVEHDQVAEFSILGDTVVGFTARDANGAVGGTPFNAASFATTGTISFDLKMTAPSDSGQVAWNFKVESTIGTTISAAEVSLTSSQEGHTTPVMDTWQTYTFNIADLVTAGLDASAIDVFMVFPAWGSGTGAVFLVDNVKVFTGGAASGGGGVGGGESSGDAPITFETDGVGSAYAWAVFENDDNPALEIVANPDTTGVNTSAMVAKFTARQTGNPWAGTESAHGDFGPFTLDSTNSTIKIMVYKSVISDVGIKFAIASGGAQGEIKVANTLVNQWEELTFDFSGNIGMVESTNIDQIIIFADFNLDGRSADTVSYFDNITFGN